MAGWRRITGPMVSLPRDNVDTDQLIPARFMSTPRSEGYGTFLLHDVRRGDDGAPDRAVPLNAHPDAKVLVAGRNFGSGSSREAAVYALVDFGIRAVLAPSFGDIFAGNAANNGLLAARITPEEAQALHARLGETATQATVDLERGTVTADNLDIAFDLDPTTRTKLINGWDDIDLTAARTDEIAAYRAATRTSRPWVWPDA